MYYESIRVRKDQRPKMTPFSTIFPTKNVNIDKIYSVEID